MNPVWSGVIVVQGRSSSFQKQCSAHFNATLHVVNVEWPPMLFFDPTRLISVKSFDPNLWMFRFQCVEEDALMVRQLAQVLRTKEIGFDVYCGEGGKLFIYSSDGVSLHGYYYAEKKSSSSFLAIDNLSPTASFHCGLLPPSEPFPQTGDRIRDKNDGLKEH